MKLSPLIPDMNGFGAPDYCDVAMLGLYNEELRKLAARYTCSLIDLTGFPPEFYADGIHLNNKGYKGIAVRVADAIEARRKYCPVQLLVRKD